MIFANFFSLLKFRLIFARNAIFRSGDKNGSKFIILFILGVLFVLGDYYFFKRILIYFSDLPMNVSEILIIQLLNLLCLTLFSMLIFSNIIASISTLYMSRDLDMLISSPIKRRELFSYKYVVTLLNSSWMALLFGIPVFVAYGNVLYAPAGYYVSIVLLYIPFLLIPASIGILATMALMRFFPARKAHQALTFLGLIFIAGIVMYLRFLQPEKFLGQDVPEEMIIGFVERMKAPDYPWLPSSMMAGALQAGVFSEWNKFLIELQWLWLTGLTSVALVIILSGKLFYSGWSSSYGARQGGLPSHERLIYRLIRALTRWASPETAALILKDVKIFWRDAAQWSQLFMLGALVVVYIFNIRNLPLNTLWLKNLVSIMNIGLAGVVLAAVAARFVFAATSMEVKSFWAIHCAPVDFSRFLWAKFFLYVIPLLILAETLVVVSNLFLNVDNYVMIVSAGTIGLVTIGIVGLGVGMGAIYPKFDFENVAEVATTSGAMLYMMSSMAFIGLAISIISRPLYIHLRNRFVNSGFDESYNWIYFTALAILVVCITIVPIVKGARALKRIET